MPYPFAMDGQIGIVAGLADHDSIAFGCAQALHDAGAEMLVTYANADAGDHIRY